ncbi:Nucleic acid binding, OB-fold, tRNA/helicase-type [Candidatus Sulfopaludibacter sp. SbA4]|nr:Nucleic acid binding, OB-fold, tRNA/helicase-type [Candidatus Sulfopaludibacter sp. SbA4]
MKKFALIAALAGAVLFVGCGSVKIARINADPSRFRNQTVHVTGNVVTSVGLLGAGGYQIEDDTGKIFVISRSGVPSRGSRVTVTGKVMPGAEVLGQAIGTAIREQRHLVK